MMTATRLDVDVIRNQASGKWREILSRLGMDLPATAKQHGPCPTCGGKDRFRFDDRDGRGSWFCNQCDPQAGDGFRLIQNVRGCEFPDALQLVADALGHQASNGHPERQIVATYDYTDAAGTLLFQVVRFLPKDFRQRRPNGHGGWIWNLNGLEPVLYRLPRVMEASHVLIVEGEKDVETAYRLGLPDGWAATCNPMGAGKWRESYSAALIGTHAVILPDEDGRDQKYAGQKHANQIAQSLKDHAASVSRLTLPDGAKDLSLWATTGTSAEFVQLLAEATPWTPILIPDSDDSTQTPNGVTASGMSGPDPGEWPEPEPVKTELLPVEPLPLSIIPLPFRAWIKDVAERMQCPSDFVAAAMLVMTSSIIGAGCGIRPKKNDDWLVIPNLWGGVVGRPSMMKTPAIGEALKPMDALSVTAKHTFDGLIKEHLAEMEAFKAQREALQGDMRSSAKKGRATAGTSDATPETLQKMTGLKKSFAELEEPKPPVWQRYVTNDATIEKMAELQASNPRGLMLFRDELVGLFATWDKDGHEADRTFYLEGWNGDRSHTSDRIGRGTTHVNNLCVSLFGGIQPAKLTSYLYAAMRGLNNDGLVQRLQVLVYPDEPTSWTLIDRPINAAAKRDAFEAVARLAAMNFRQYGAFGDEDQIPYFRFADEAQGVFNDWLTELEGKLRTDEEPVLQEHFGKYRSLMPSLALQFHVLNLAHAPSVSMGPVTKECAMQAAAWCEYLEAHARRVYGMVTNLTAQAASRLAGKLHQRALPQKFTVRDVYRKEWSLLDDRQVIENACEELVSLGWLREHVIPSAPGQKGKTEYTLNPKVRP